MALEAYFFNGYGESYITTLPGRGWVGSTSKVGFRLETLMMPIIKVIFISVDMVLAGWEVLNVMAFDFISPLTRSTTRRLIPANCGLLMLARTEPNGARNVGRLIVTGKVSYLWKNIVNR